MHKNRPFSFSEIFNCIWVDRKYGPQRPIGDYRFAAGALFERGRENMRKVLVCIPGEYPFIETTCYHSGSEQSHMLVTKEAAKRLIDERLVRRDVRSWTPYEYVLTELGKQKVAREWCGSATLGDHLKAGSVISLEKRCK